MRILVFIWSLFFACWGLAQPIQNPSSVPRLLELEVQLLDQSPTFFRQQNIKQNYPLKDSTALAERLQKLLHQLQSKAYLAASIDSFFYVENKIIAYLKVGKKYEWATLENGNIAAGYLSAIGFRERFFVEQPFYYKELLQLQTKLLDYLENHGYPFAQVYLDSIRITGQEIAAKLYYDKGPQIFFDKIKIESKPLAANSTAKKKKVRITTSFLVNYLSLKKGNLYQEKQVQKIQQRLQNLRYIRSFASPYIIFKDQKAELHLSLTDRPVSKVDVLFGILPSQDPVTQQQRLDFTGNILIDLVNPLGTGKHLLFQWQQLKAGTSDLLLRLEYPYLLQSPLGADVAFKLYKRDSTFLDIIGDIGLQYLFNGNSYIKAFWKPKTTNLIYVDTATIALTHRLPTALDLNTATFGLEYYFNNLDYQYNPRKGFETKLTAEFMLKQVRKNNEIIGITDPRNPSFNFASLYDSLDLNTFQYRLEWKHSHFFQLWKWSTLMSRIDIGLLISAKEIYKNELFRIGGNRRLRGFDEESILATWYNILSLEWRFLFGKNSYAYLFGDFAYTQNQSVVAQSQDFPLGFGLGIALETKIGIFGLSYALGSQQGNPILFQNSKLHFGYVYSF